MKKIFILLVIIFSFSNPICFADSNDNPAMQQKTNEQIQTAVNLNETGVSKEYLAEQKVKMLPSKHGGTVDAYMTNMTKIPIAKDLGWTVKEVGDGYEVERSILIKDSKTFRYIWKVSGSGDITPANDRAKSLMK